MRLSEMLDSKVKVTSYVLYEPDSADYSCRVCPDLYLPVSKLIEIQLSAHKEVRKLTRVIQDIDELILHGERQIAEES